MQKNALKKLFTSHKWDLILGAALLLIALCLFLVFGKMRKTGTYVQIEQDGKIIGSYSLDENREMEIKTFYGSNTLVIENGVVYVKDSTCKDKRCEHMGKISKDGEMIICLPHELFIKIINGKGGAFDAISQ